MKVYLVFYQFDQYVQATLQGVFSSKQNAKKYIKKLYESYRPYCYCVEADIDTSFNIGHNFSYEIPTKL